MIEPLDPLAFSLYSERESREARDLRRQEWRRDYREQMKTFQPCGCTNMGREAGFRVCTAAEKLAGHIQSPLTRPLARIMLEEAYKRAHPERCSGVEMDLFQPCEKRVDQWGDGSGMDMKGLKLLTGME